MFLSSNRYSFLDHNPKLLFWFISEFTILMMNLMHDKRVVRGNTYSINVRNTMGNMGWDQREVGCSSGPI